LRNLSNDIPVETPIRWWVFVSFAEIEAGVPPEPVTKLTEAFVTQANVKGH